MSNGQVIGCCLAMAVAAGAVAQVVPIRPGVLPGQYGAVPASRAPRLDAPIFVCFKEGTDPAYAARWTNYVDIENRAFFGQDYQLTNRWSGTRGTPRTLTWSFVPDGLSISGGVGEAAAPSNLFATMDSAFASQGGRATWTNRFQQVFDRWHALTGLTYQRITVNGNDWDDGAGWGAAGGTTRGDVRISAHNIDGRNGVLAYCQFPSNGDMVLDSGDIAAGVNFGAATNQNRFLRNVVAHEHGHGIGLLHVCPASGTKLMEPYIDTGYDGPRQDDIRGAQTLYGDPFENNNTAATATPLGALNVGSSLNLGTLPPPIIGTSDASAALLSIDTGTAEDWYSFSSSVPMNLTATITPVGSSYLQGPQTNNCDNTGTTTTNGAAVATLIVDVYDSNGTTQLGSGTAPAAGSPAVAANIALNTAATRYIRVHATGLIQTQSYRVTLTGNSPCPAFTQSPMSQTACEGYQVVMQVVVAGFPTPTLQWRHNMVDIPGATSDTYTINSATAMDAGMYDVVATNSCGSFPSNAATLTVNTAPSITQQPQNATVPVGSPVTFSVGTTGADYFQWRHNNQLIPNANSAQYMIGSVQQSDAGTYDVIVSNECDLTTSNPATLTIGNGACYPNCDNSTTQPILNVNDFICFQSKFAAGDPYANCDGSTQAPVLNVNDFICFQGRFAAGCP